MLLSNLRSLQFSTTKLNSPKLGTPKDTSQVPCCGEAAGAGREGSPWLLAEELGTVRCSGALCPGRAVGSASSTAVLSRVTQELLGFLRIKVIACIPPGGLLVQTSIAAKLKDVFNLK